MKTRKELKEEYKQRTPTMGVFQIRNLATGKVFVQKATDLSKIWESQLFKLTSGGHSNAELQRDWNELGPDNFTFEVLHELPQSNDPALDPRAELTAFEALCLDDLQPYGDKGYNRPPASLAAGLY